MKTIYLYGLLKQRVLVTRESVKALTESLAQATEESLEPVQLDFAEIEGITPSFLDQLLHSLEQLARATGKQSLEVRILHPPSRLSSKFEAVGRGHGATIKEIEGGTWRILLKTSTATRP
jgi:hypothetical protein